MWVCVHYYTKHFIYMNIEHCTVCTHTIINSAVLLRSHHYHQCGYGTLRFCITFSYDFSTFSFYFLAFHLLWLLRFCIRWRIFSGEKFNMYMYGIKFLTLIYSVAYRSDDSIRRRAIHGNISSSADMCVCVCACSNKVYVQLCLWKMQLNFRW